MTLRPFLAYCDTSVFGGAFDAEFDAATHRFLEDVRHGRFALVTSAVVQAELEAAPEPVRTLFDELLPGADVAEITSEALALRDAYIRAGVVTAKSLNDALHVALATVNGCALIVSWNFKHIVHFQKIPLYNAVNRAHGYGEVGIYSPLELVRSDEDEDV